MTEQRHRLIPRIIPRPPFVWPDHGVLDGQQQYAVEPPYAQLLKGASRVEGLVHGIDGGGVQWLHEQLAANPELAALLVIAVSPACPTDKTTLTRLGVELRTHSGRMNVRVLPMIRWDSTPGTSLRIITPSNRYLATGPTGGLGLLGATREACNLVFQPSRALEQAWMTWFKAILEEGAPLDGRTLQIPELSFPKPSDNAADIWHAYVETCEASRAQRAAAQELSPAGLSDLVPPDGGPTDPLRQRLETLFASGALVTIDKNTRLPPLEAPIKHEWFGLPSTRTAGRISERRSLSIRIFNDLTTHKELGKLRERTRTCLELLGFSFADGHSWVPNQAWSILSHEIEEANREGLALVERELAGGATEYLNTERPRIEEDARRLLADIAPGHRMPADAVDKVVSEMASRLTRVYSGTFAPKVTRHRMRPILTETGSAISEWASCVRLLVEIARRPREILLSPFEHLHGLPKTVVLEAVNVLDDQLLRAGRSLRDYGEIEDESQLINRIERSDLDGRTKCAYLFELIDSGVNDGLRNRVDQELGAAADGRVGSAGALTGR